MYFYQLNYCIVLLSKWESIWICISKLLFSAHL